MTISKKATNRLWDVGDLALMVERRAAGPGAERALRENEVIDLIAEPIDNPALESRRLRGKRLHRGQLRRWTTGHAASQPQSSRIKRTVELHRFLGGGGCEETSRDRVGRYLTADLACFSGGCGEIRADAPRTNAAVGSSYRVDRLGSALGLRWGWS